MPHLVDGSCNVHHLLILDLLQDAVNADEGPSATNTSTADKNHYDSAECGFCVDYTYLQCTSIGPLLALCLEMILLW